MEKSGRGWMRYRRVHGAREPGLAGLSALVVLTAWQRALGRLARAMREVLVNAGVVECDR
jgi:hypothetical protein